MGLRPREPISTPVRWRGGLALFHGVLPGHRLGPGGLHEADALSIAYDVPQALRVVPEIPRNPQVFMRGTFKAVADDEVLAVARRQACWQPAKPFPVDVPPSFRM